MSERQLLAVTEEIYDAAAGGTPWSAVGKSLSQLVGASSGWIVVSDPRAGSADLLYRADFQSDDITAYQTRYRPLDLWTNRVAAAVAREGPQARPKTRISGHLVPDAEYKRSEFYADFGKRLGLRHVIGTVVPLGAAGMLPIGLHRPDGADPFEAADARLLDCLLPHLRRAMQLRHRLSPGASSMPPGLAALDALATAVAVVDADMRLLVANAAAEALAASGTAIRIVLEKMGAGPRQKVLTALHHKDQMALRALVRATAAGGAPGGALRLRDGSLTPAIAALVSPLPQRLSDTPGGLSGRVVGQALILLRDLGSASLPPSSELLRKLFGLTHTEAEVACALYGGATKSSVAAKRGLRESTIRTHVNSILRKTGAGNLRDLERILTSIR
jgi:DNA-binding CsgD family transcriptional regulator